MDANALSHDDRASVATAHHGGAMTARAFHALTIVLVSLAVAGAGATIREAAAALPPGNTVAQWNKIAEDTVVGSGAFQNEGLVYMAYVSAAVYDAAVAVEGGYEPYGIAIGLRTGASADAAVVEASYRTLAHYFPAQAASLASVYAESLGLISDGPAKSLGQAVGQLAATNVVALRNGDGRMTPVGTTSLFPRRAAGPGVWRLTPPFAAPQTPWVASVRPFVLKESGQFRPGAPPPLRSRTWTHEFAAIKALGAATGSVRTDEQTAIARFWSANVIRQYNRLARDIAQAHGLGLVETARLAAMVNVVGADAQIAVMDAKYHHLFWRPVTAIDPSAVTDDGMGPFPIGFDDGNPATAEQTGWRPLLTTPNHPEYPAAHGSITSAMAEVFRLFLGTRRIDVDIAGFDPAGPPGNLNATRHFERTRDLRAEIVDARNWAGLHYRFSGEVGVHLGRDVARYDLGHAFRRVAGHGNKSPRSAANT
jgi:hypothetical protein